MQLYCLTNPCCSTGSTDCTHFALGKCSAKISVLCTGKEGFPTLAYSMTSSHSRKILYCSTGFFGTRNDKAISKNDEFINLIRTLPLYTNFEWKMHVDEVTTKVKRLYFYLIEWPFFRRCKVCFCCAMVAITSGRRWCARWSTRLECLTHCGHVNWRACAKISSVPLVFWRCDSRYCSVLCRTWQRTGLLTAPESTILFGRVAFSIICS